MFAQTRIIHYYVCLGAASGKECKVFMKLELLTYEKENLPCGWKPYYIYLIMVDHIEVGRIVLREGSNEERYYDGHIGYTIEKEYRGHH